MPENAPTSRIVYAAKAIRIVSAPRLPQIAAVAGFQAVRGVAAPLVFSGTPFANPDAVREPGLRLSATLAVAAGAIRAGSGQGVTVGGTARARTFSGTLAALNAYFTDTVGRITYLANPLVSGPRRLGISLAKRVARARERSGCCRRRHGLGSMWREACRNLISAPRRTPHSAPLAHFFPARR